MFWSAFLSLVFFGLQHFLLSIASFCFVYFLILRFSFFTFLFPPFFGLICFVCSFAYILKKKQQQQLLFIFLSGVISKESVSLKRDTVCPVRRERFWAAPHVCTVDTATWSLPPFLRGVVTHGWTLGSGHPALTCEPPGWPCSGWPHCDSACSDSGLRVPCLCRCVLSSMARFFPACLPPCFFPCRSVQWQGDWQCFGRRLKETYQLQLHCFRGSCFMFRP